MVGRITIQELIKALDYPEALLEGGRDFVFRVDGLEIQASEQANGILLRFVLPCSEELIPEFARYAAGRFLREDAALAWDNQGLFIWQLLPSSSDAEMLRDGFERFADSCEWWLARCSEMEVPRSVLPDILIRP